MRAARRLLLALLLLTTSGCVAGVARTYKLRPTAQDEHVILFAETVHYVDGVIRIWVGFQNRTLQPIYVEDRMWVTVLGVKRPLRLDGRAVRLTVPGSKRIVRALRADGLPEDAREATVLLDGLEVPNADHLCRVELTLPFD